jgi:LysR family transcriptional regulator, low CO2-responsive transcriptional regulator
MEIKNLRAFYFVGKYGNLPKAANYLKLTSPAISVQLKKLEKELRVKLFERHPNKLVLTAKGRILLDEVSRILESLTTLQDLASQAPPAAAEKLTIALGSDLPKFLAPQIAAFSQENPRLQLTIVSKPSETLSLLLAGTVDLAIGWFPQIPRTLQKKTLFNSRLYLIFPATHSLASRRKINLEDVAAFPLILPSSRVAARRIVDSGFYSNGVEIKNVLEVGTCDSILEFVRRNIGIGFVHDICFPKNGAKDIRSHDMGNELGTIEVSLVYKESIRSQPSYQALIDSFCKPRRKQK